MLSPRDRRNLAIFLPLGIVIAILLDGVAFVAIGVPGYIPSRTCACPAIVVPQVGLGAPNWSASSGSVQYPILEAAPGLEVGNLTMEFTTAGGVALTEGISGVLLQEAGPVALYNFTAGAWTFGGSVIVRVGDAFAVTSPDFNLLLGGNLTVWGNVYPPP